MTKPPKTSRSRRFRAGVIPDRQGRKVIAGPTFDHVGYRPRENLGVVGDRVARSIRNGDLGADDAGDERRRRSPAREGVRGDR